MTKKTSLKPKKVRKFRIVLDSAFAKLDFFPKLRKRAKLFHSVYDFGLSREAEDLEIYQKAYQENCFVLTINFKDFKKLVKKNGPGIFGVESQLTTARMDSIVYEFLAGKNPKDFLGKAIKLPTSGSRVEKSTR